MRSLSLTAASWTVLGLVVGSPAQAQVTAPASSAAPAPITAFVDVSVVPMDRERVLAHQTVVVREGHIVALGPVRQVRVPAAAVRIDGRGQFLIPGLADMHVHLWPALPVFKDSVLVADELFAFVAGGVTTIRDMHSGGPTSPLLRWRQQVASGAQLGPRIYTAGDPTVGDGTADGADVGPAIAALKAAGHDFVKFYDYSRATYNTAMAVAHRVGLRVVGHMAKEVATRLPATLQGWSSIEHLTAYTRYFGMDFPSPLEPPDPLRPWGQPGFRLDSARLRELAVATRRAVVWKCPTTARIFSAFAAMAKTSENSLYVEDTVLHGFHDQMVKALQEAGAGLLLCADTSPWSPETIRIPEVAAPGASVHDELRELVHAGLTPYQALATGTRNVAEFLGTLDSTGTVAVGKRADLVLLSANPLEDIRHTRALAGVMVNGHWFAPAAVVARLETWPNAPSRQEAERLKSAEQLRWGLRKGLRALWP